MQTLAPGIEQWASYSDEKQINFNGLILTRNGWRIVVDPPPLEDADRAAVLSGPPVNYVLLTNRDHVREADWFRRECRAPVYAPVADAPLMEIAIDNTYADDERLPGGLLAIHLPNMKSPGESALLLREGRGYLIVGDALIGKPAGHLRLLPEDKFADITQAKHSLRRLLTYEYDAVLVGDGDSILTGGKDAVRRAVEG